jgi:Ser/Thr protein kinase RdoA (MazF antagonist)
MRSSTAQADKLAHVLAAEYGIRDATLTLAPRGSVSETYYVDTGNGRYFAKIAKLSQYTEYIERTLPALLELHRLGIEQISYPIPTTDGRLSVRADDLIFVMLNCVEGRWEWRYPTTTPAYPFEPYVRLLARVHQLSSQVNVPLVRETFDLSYKRYLLPHLDQLQTGTFDNPHEQALQAFINAHRDELLRDIALLDEVQAKMRSAQLPFILTHSDAFGNVLYDGEQVSIVDWDDLMLAPSERDTWFHRTDPAFLPLYRQFVPGYTFDETAYRFYLYKRYLEDVEGAISVILSPDSTDEYKASYVTGLRKSYFVWFRPLLDEDLKRQGG